MKILVCIKQVPDMESKFKIDGPGQWYDTTDLAWRMNEYDEYAVEQSILIKEELGNSDITVLCIGPRRVQETMKKALAMGCDRGVHVEDDSVHQRDPLEISSIIAEFAKGEQFDLIFTGLQSQDRGSGQVGLFVAEILELPSVSTIISFTCEGKEIEVKRELEGGMKAVVRLQAPVLLTCQLGLNKPRYPTLPNIMKAKRKELSVIDVEQLRKVEPICATKSLFVPEKKNSGLILEGEVSELANELIKHLKEKTSFLA